MKRKITKQSLAELAKVMPVVPEWEMRFMVGGTGSVVTGSTGSIPEYSYDEYDQMMANETWKGGMVIGLGYMTSISDCVITGIAGNSGSNSSIAYGAGAIGSGSTSVDSPAVSGGGGGSASAYCKIN